MAASSCKVSAGSDDPPVPDAPKAEASDDTKVEQVHCEECRLLAPWLKCEQANALRDALNNVLEWKVGRALGIGGISVCFEAENCSEIVAVKVSHVNSTAANDFIADVAEDEKDVLEDLHFSSSCNGAQGIPEIHCSGSVTVNNSAHHYIVMQRLGCNLDALINLGHISKSNFIEYALGMLEAVETVHEAGWVHLDIKPGNFCEVHRSGAPADVYIIDFGGARRIPSAKDFDDEHVFFGTANYSGSAAMKQEMMPGPADDIESLCYSFLHMWTGELPWTVTENFKLGVDGWAPKDLLDMLELRTKEWETLCLKEDIPLFLQELHEYAMSLQPYEIPDYKYLRQIIQMARAKPQQLPTHARIKRRFSEPAAERPKKHMRLRTGNDAHLLQLEE